MTGKFSFYKLQWKFLKRWIGRNKYVFCKVFKRKNCEFPLQSLKIKTKMKYLILLCLATVFVSSAVGTAVTKCSSGSVPAWVDLNGCVKGPCTLRHGQNAKVQIRFVSPVNTKTLRSSVIATYGSQKFPIQLSGAQSNGCNSLTGGSSCPVQAGSTNNYGFSIPVDTSLPLVSWCTYICCCFSDFSKHI